MQDDQPNPVLQPLSIRATWSHLLIVFALVFGLYALTLPRTVVLEDDGGFILAAHFAGIAHPPGYPLWVLLASGFDALPLGSVATRVHLSSAVYGAAACASLWWIVRRLVPSNAVAYTAALAFGASEILWSQSIIADVYSLNLLVFLLLLIQALGFLESPSKSRLAVMSLLYGLGLCNHWPLLVLATPCLALVMWPRRAEVGRGLWVALPMLVIGLTPYLWMLWRSNTDPTISFYGPIRSLRELLYYVSRRGYTQGPVAHQIDWVDKVQYAGFLVRENALQLTLPGFALAIWGMASQWTRSRVSWNLALLAGFASGSFALLPLIRVEYDFLERLQFRVFPLIPYAVSAIWLAFGVSHAAEWLRERSSLDPRRLVPVFGTLLVCVLLASNWSRNDRADDTYALDYGRTLLESLPRDAVFFTFHDFDVFPMGYLNLVEGVRPDIELYHRAALLFPSRLYHGRAAIEEKELKLREFLRSNDRPVFFAQPQRVEQGFALEEFGFYSRLMEGEPGARRYTIREDLFDLAKRMTESGRLDHRGDLIDGWSRGLRLSTELDYAKFLYSAMEGTERDGEAATPEALASRRELLASLTHSFFGSLGRLSAALERDDAPADQLMEWTRDAELRIDDTVGERLRSHFFRMKGEVLVKHARGGEAAEAFETSIELDPDPENGAVIELMRLHANAGERERYLALRRRFFSNRVAGEEVARLDRVLGI